MVINASGVIDYNVYNGKTLLLVILYSNPNLSPSIFYFLPFFLFSAFPPLGGEKTNTICTWPQSDHINERFLGHCPAIARQPTEPRRYPRQFGNMDTIYNFEMELNFGHVSIMTNLLLTCCRPEHNTNVCSKKIEVIYPGLKFFWFDK